MTLSVSKRPLQGRSCLVGMPSLGSSVHRDVSTAAHSWLGESDLEAQEEPEQLVLPEHGHYTP